MTNDKLAATFHGADPAQARLDDIAMDRAATLNDYSVRLYGPCGLDPDCRFPDGHGGGHEPDQERALRNHIADLLTDVDHFNGCHRWVEGDGTCTCLVGRIEWAITAEQVTEPREDGAA
jgi:hypothetical protein